MQAIINEGFMIPSPHDDDFCTKLLNRTKNGIIKAQQKVFWT